MAKNETYEEFVEKFKPKKTTDDCYTPEPVYEAVRDWAIKEYGWQGRDVVRPFWPGGDYEHYEYPEGCVVIDNPPFSCLSKIVDFYNAHGIAFFLFAPALTLFGTSRAKSHIAAYCEIEYANGAKVKTSFLCSEGACVRTAPGLSRAVKAAVEQVRKQRVVELPKYKYPDGVLTSAEVGSWSALGIEYSEDRCVFVRKLDAQDSKAIFGSGYLAPRMEAERARMEAERARMEAERAEKPRIVWTLSAREEEIVRGLEQQAEGR